MIESQLRLRMGNFKASCGWLDRSDKWHDISFKCMNGRKGNMSEDTVECWNVISTTNWSIFIK